MNKTAATLAAGLLALTTLAACGPKQESPAEPATKAEPAGMAADAMPRSPSPADARVFFVSPADGAVVNSPVKVEFGVSGMKVVPAGQAVPNSGHHHLLIDTGLPPLDQPIPADDQHVHFGDGSTSTEIELPPGKHTLQLLFADHAHVPHDPPVYSDRITITVE